jgi:hypothetical protein
LEGTAVDKDTQVRLPFTSIRGKKVEADFDGGVFTSDSGMLLLREVNREIGVIERMASALGDERHPSYIEHSLEELLSQRVFQLACGYEDGNDCDDLRSDPALKAACNRLPLTGEDLASQPTISRLENAPGPRDLYRLAIALGELFIESYDKPPKKIILDLDDTDDVVHGSQQLCLFNAFVDDYCYMPLHIYEGLSGKLITTILRPGKRPKGVEIASVLNRVLGFIREAWPKTHIIVRGDSHFSAPEVHDLCEDVPGVDYILGQAVNKTLKRLGEPLMNEVLATAEKAGETDKPIRAYSEFEYKAGSWRHPRRIIYKAEVTQGKANPRFVVTSLPGRTPKHLYKKIYSARGRMENYIKEHKNHLKSDRTSCSTFEANQFRLFLHSAAYVLLHALRERALQGTQLATATFETIQLRILKIAARVRERATKIEFHFPSSCPVKDLLRTIVMNFDTA